MKTFPFIKIKTHGILIPICCCCIVWATEPSEKTIVTSFYPIYITTINIAQNIPGVRVVNLTRPTTGCLHDYQLTPQEMKTLATASVFIVNGLGMESFLEKVIRQYPKLILVRASDNIPVLQKGNDTNPHVWVDIALAKTQAANITKGLAKTDPANASRYETNGNAYATRLQELETFARRELKDISHKDIITFHEAFSYFAQEFGLRIAGVIEREPGAQPNARDIAQSILLARKTGIRTIFAEPQYPTQSAETIARESGATVYILDPVVGGPLDQNAYITIMKNNIATLKKALH